MSRFIIIGGGITGCVAAWNLARRGHRVHLIEKRRIAAMASGWTLGGVRQSGRHPAELPLARAAVALWPSLADQLGHDTGYRQGGNLRLARTTEEAAAIRSLVHEQNGLGLDLHFLDDNGAVRAVAPAISASVLAASHCPSDGYAAPVPATTAFALAAQSHGATIETGNGVDRLVVSKGRVSGVETGSGFLEADRVIVAAGTHTPALLAPLGLTLPMAVTMVQVVQTESVPHCLDQVFGVANADCAGRQEPDGRFRYTSGVRRFDGDSDNWTEARLAPSAQDITALQERVRSVLPVAAETPIASTWGGLIDLTPDHLPVIDAPCSHPGLVIAAGFSGHGFGIGPVTGEMAAKLALGETPDLDLSSFRLSRFLSREPSFQSVELHG